MKFLPYLSALFLTSCVSFHSCHAQPPVKIVGKDNVEKHIRLLHLSPERMKRENTFFFSKAEKNYGNGIVHFTNSAHSVDVGMSDVSVLDQGEFGTCVTFSSTAALDARIQGGDFISQECSLALDVGLGANYWDGANYPSQVIDPLKTYGVVSNNKCPVHYADDSYSLAAADYQAFTDVEASYKVAAIKYVYSAAANLNAVKAALKAGHRVLMAFQLSDASQTAVQGFDIIVDGVQNSGGLWACKQGGSPNYCQDSNGGHEVLIIGYDDKQQLLKIRNSWGIQLGDNGDYYMTYTFFNTMAVDTTIIN